MSLFGIIMGEIGEDEVGCAGGLPESLHQLGASLPRRRRAGHAVFRQDQARGWRIARRGGDRRHLVAAQDTLFVTVPLAAVAFAIGWLVPRRVGTMR